MHIRREIHAYTRGAGSWFETGAHLAVARARYHMLKKWDALFEYRWLETEERDDSKDGALLGVYRHVGKHMKVGAGYNFTDFDDDLTNNDYDSNGWFFRYHRKVLRTKCGNCNSKYFKK